MPKFYVECMCIVSGTAIVEAASAQEAADIVRAAKTMPEIQEILPDSFRILDVNTAQ